jgi:hypothetical protein
MEYDVVADLSLRVDAWEHSTLERDTASGFRRMTTVFECRGGEDVGAGEDVTYEADHHSSLAESGVDLPTGRFTFEDLSVALDDVELFPDDDPDRAVFRNYRRWAVESAALDLALRQADTDLGTALGRSYDPVRFVASTRLGDPPTTDRVDALRSVHPDVELKLDPTPAWTDDLVAELAATDAVCILDLKGRYEGTQVDTPVDPDLYERLFEAFPDVILEDPGTGEAVDPLVETVTDRVSWDVPIHGLADVRDLPYEPNWINLKPSRFGTVKSLFETVAYCDREGVETYGGGQFELGVGREQIQALASLAYPDSPNDVAPAAYNDPEVRPDLLGSPLSPSASVVGFRFD